MLNKKLGNLTLFSIVELAICFNALVMVTQQRMSKNIFRAVMLVIPYKRNRLAIIICKRKSPCKEPYYSRELLPGCIFDIKRSNNAWQKPKQSSIAQAAETKRPNGREDVALAAHGTPLRNISKSLLR